MLGGDGIECLKFANDLEKGLVLFYAQGSAVEICRDANPHRVGIRGK
jgi:hypothetical protein